MKTNPAKPIAALLAMLIAASFATPAATAVTPAEPGHAPTLAASGTGASDLAALAQMFGEEPGSTSADAASASCGLGGHCNFVGCPEPSCPAGQYASYACTATAQRCPDSHDWYNPFDNDEHVVYNCSSSCTPSSPPPDDEQEPACTVKNPVGDGCLVRECATKLPAGDLANKMDLGSAPDAGC